MPSASDVAFIFDSDALIQTLLAAPTSLFSDLQATFAVRSYLMAEVETEVLSNRKFGAMVRPRLEKALRSKSLKLLSSSDLEKMTPEGNSAASLADIRQLASDYELYVGRGEAHTHAAGVLLQTPTVSNDMNAVQALQRNGRTLPPVILRSFDLFGFLYFEQLITEHAAEGILKELKSRNEWVPRALQHASFAAGIRNFGCRLSTSLSVSASTSWSETFYLKRVTSA